MIVEFVGSSNKWWYEVLKVAFKANVYTTRNYRRLEVQSKTATLDSNNDWIAKYHATIKLSFYKEC